MQKVRIAEVILEIDGWRGLVSIKRARGDILFTMGKKWSSRISAEPILLIFLYLAFLNRHLRVVFEVVGSIEVVQGITVERA